MCGILGKVNSGRELELQSIKHRGPDSSGLFVESNICLGHVRLSIQDLSEQGAQPFYSDDRRFVIIYNGEIYNHQELKNELVDLGYYFNSTSDTETVLKAYIHWGVKAFSKLNGIFAFSIYDREKKKLVIVRDRFGIKPLYYQKEGNQLIFSSELKGVKETSHLSKELNYNGLANYIRFLWSPGMDTPIVGVKKLLPAHYLEVDTNKSTIVIEEKSFYKSGFTGIYNSNESKIIDELERLLITSVERQLLSDVPVGFFLSGGLDSSLIVAIAKRLRPEEKLQCFTIDTSEFGKKEGFSNDLEYAKKVAEYLDVNLEVVEAKPDILKDFDKMIWHLDEPQADSAPLNVLNISERAREMGYKVLLGGSGGDDVFSGYRRHQALKYERIFKMIPQSLLNIGALIGIALPPKTATLRRVKKLTSNLSYSNTERLIGYFEWLTWKDAYKLFTPEISKKLKTQDPFKYFKQKLEEIPNEKSDLNRMLHLEMATFLVDHNFNYTDKMGMAAGVEIRVPFLDNELVSFSYSIHPDLKLKGSETKYILKKVAERYLPHDVIYRSKAGFGAPVREWITSELKAEISEKLSPSRLDRQGIFNSQAVTKLINDNQDGKIDASYSIWALLAIQSWIDQFLTD